MTRRKSFENEESYQSINTNDWPRVLIDNLSEENKEIFLVRKKAVDMYFSNKSMEEILKETKIHRNLVRRLVKRCLEIDSTGMPYGYTALIPYKRLKKYNRSNSMEKDFNNHYVGAFSKLLEEHSELEELITKQYLGTYKRGITEHNISPNVLHRKFLNKCRSIGIKENEYPFITHDKGRRSLYRYTSNLKNIYYHDYTKRHGDDAYKRLTTVGIGEQNSPIITRPFQQVQFDGHKIDMILSIKFKTIEGDIIVKPMRRIWLLAIIDVATRVILGYHLCLSPEYSSSDVLKCIENAILPKDKRKITISNLQYPPNGGVHSLYIQETKWALWDEFLYDNAKANLAKIVTEKLTKLIKCSVNAGPVATPERRGIIERFFKTLEERGYHRLVSTVGNGPKDPRRKNSEENAITYEISENEIEELTEILIANYNNTPHDGINGFTPLDVMKQRIERGQVPRIMEEYGRKDLAFLSLTVTRKVSGNIKSGHRPYIFYEGVEYRNDVLAKMPDLIGKNLTLLVNINDLRMVKAYLPDGSEFGILTAKGKWSIKPHTLKMRQEINRLKRNKDIHIYSYDDPIEVYHNFLVEKSDKNKSSRNKLATLNRVTKKLSNTLNKEAKDINESIKDTDNSTKRENNLTNSDNDRIEELKKSDIFKTLNF